MDKYIWGSAAESMGVLEKDFISALNALAAGDDSITDRLFIAYNRLCASIQEDMNLREDRMRLVCSALLRALDNAPDGEIARTLHAYTFRDFLEIYSEEPTVQAVIGEFLDDGELHKLPLVIALGRYRGTE